MGAETPPAEEGTPQIAEGGLVLLADPLRRWPASLLEPLQERGPLTILDAEPPLEEAPPHSTLLLGYGDPRAGLAEALAHETAPDVAALLAAWQRSGERMLQLRQRPGSAVLLVDLGSLDAAAEAALLQRLAPGQPLAGLGEGDPDLERDPDRETPELPPVAGSTLPPVVAHYLAQRPEIDQLLADLAGCAERLGRDPQPPPTAPPARGLVLAEQLLHDWLAVRVGHHQEVVRLEQERQRLQAELTTTSGVLADVAGLHRQAEAETEELRRQGHHQEQRLAEAHGELEAMRQQLETMRQQLAEEEARQRDGEEERELILLQLKQVQDELSHTFEELRQARGSGEALAQRLTGLEEECRTLFLHSRLNPQIDRTKIATILQLVRENLRV